MLAKDYKMTDPERRLWGKFYDAAMELFIEREGELVGQQAEIAASAVFAVGAIMYSRMNIRKTGEGGVEIGKPEFDKATSKLASDAFSDFTERVESKRLEIVSRN